MSETEKLASEKIGALWKRKSKQGTDYLFGTVNGEGVVVFRVKEKLSPKSPDYLVLKAFDRETKNDEKKAPTEKDDEEIPF
jgi:hypothetical protein